jgi:hypothetical protein
MLVQSAAAAGLGSMKIPSAAAHAIRAKKDSDMFQSYGAPMPGGKGLLRPVVDKDRGTEPRP